MIELKIFRYYEILQSNKLTMDHLKYNILKIILRSVKLLLKQR